MPFAPQHRHSAHSRGIHLRMPTHQPETPAALALRYGYCDFAQYDDRWHSGDRCGIQCPLRPNTVIPRAVAESISACQRTSRRRQRPWHSALRYGYCDFAQYDGRWHSGDRCGIQCPLRPNTVIPCAVAESISACQRTSRRRQRPWHSDMDTATSRSMTAVGIPVTVAEFSALCAPTASFRAQSRNPSPPANAPAGDASGLGTPIWILRLRAV